MNYMCIGCDITWSSCVWHCVRDQLECGALGTSRSIWAGSTRYRKGTSVVNSCRRRRQSKHWQCLRSGQNVEVSGDVRRLYGKVETRMAIFTLCRTLSVGDDTVSSLQAFALGMMMFALFLLLGPVCVIAQKLYNIFSPNTTELPHEKNSVVATNIYKLLNVKQYKNVCSNIKMLRRMYPCRRNVGDCRVNTKQWWITNMLEWLFTLL